MTDWDLDDDYKVALIDGIPAQAEARQAVVGGNFWATQTVEVYKNKGSDRFRRNLSGVHRITMYMKQFKWVTEEQLGYFNIMISASQIIFGGMIIHAGIVNMYRAYETFLIEQAAAETAANVAKGPSGWLKIAFATAMTATILASTMAGVEAGINISQTQQISSKANYRTSSGRQTITTTIRNAKPSSGGG